MVPMVYLKPANLLEYAPYADPLFSMFFNQLRRTSSHSRENVCGNLISILKLQKILVYATGKS